MCTFEMPSSKCHKPRGDEVVGILAGTADEVLFRVVPCAREQKFPAYEELVFTLSLLYYSNLQSITAVDDCRNA